MFRRFLKLGGVLVTLWMVPAQSQTSRRGDRIPPQILNLIIMQNEKRCREGRQQQDPGHTEFGMMGAEERRMDYDGTDYTVMGGGEERGAPRGPPRDGTDQEGDGQHPHEDAKEVVCGDGAREDHCYCRHMDFLIGRYPRVGKDAIIQRIDIWDDTRGGTLGDQAIFVNTLKSIGSHQEDYEAKLETMLVQPQGMVDKMIKYDENVEDRMKELDRRAGVPAQGPDLPQDPAPKSLVRRLTTFT